MATEAETPESISVMKIKEEIKELASSHFDTTVSKASIVELLKVEDEHCSPPDTVGNSTKTEVLEVVTDAKDTENQVLEGKVGNSEGESFLKSPSVTNIASEEICKASDDWEDKEQPILVEKEVENVMQLVEQNSTATSMKNARVEEEEIAKSASEMKNVEECIGENFPSIPITFPSIDQNVQEGKTEGGKSEVVEGNKQKSEDVSDDKRTLTEEAQKDEILHNQLVEISKAVYDEQMTEAICATQSVQEEEVATDSKKDEIEGKMSGEDPSFESGEQVDQTIQATPDHNQESSSLDLIKESLNNDDKSAGDIETMEVSTDKNMELLACSNGKNRNKNEDSQKITIKQEVGKTNSEEVIETKEQDKSSNLLGTEEIENDKKAGDENPQAIPRGVLEGEETTSHNLDITSITTATEEVRSLNAEPEESGTLEYASSLSLEDKKEAEKPKEEMSKGLETANSSEYIDKKIKQEDDPIKEQYKVSLLEETIQSSHEGKGEKKDKAEGSEGLEVDDLSKDAEEQIIEEYDVVTEHCTVSDVEETAKQTNQEDEKESKEEDCMGTKTTITDEDIQKPPSEDSNAVKDHCTASVGEETVKESSQEVEEAKKPEVEVFEVLETNVASEDTAKQIIEDTVLTHLSRASIGEETLKQSSQEDDAHERIEGAGDGKVTEKDISATDLPTIFLGEETIRSSEENEVCKEVQTTGATEDAVKESVEEHGAVTDIEAVAIGEVTSTEEYIQKTASKDNPAVRDHCTVSVGEETAKESYQEDEEANKPNVEVFEGLETNGASEDTAKHIVEDGSVTYQSTASIGEETIKESSQEDEVNEKIEEVGNGKVTEEQIIEEEIAATDLPTISLGEETVRSSQEDEVCKELETTGPSENSVKESVEEHGAVTDINAVAIAEVTTTENSQEEEKEAKSQGEVKESDLISKELNFKTTDCTQNIETVTLTNEEDPNKIPTTSVITEASGEEIQEERNEKLAGSSMVSKVSEEHIKGEISEKEVITIDKLETEPAPIVNEKISLNEAEPEGADLIDGSDLPSEESSPVPIEATGTSLLALHVEDVKLEENSNSDENAQSKVSFVEETIQSSQKNEVEKKDEAEVSEGLEMDDLSKDTEERIKEEYNVVKEHYTVSDVEETVKQTNQEDEKESEEEDCMGTKTTITDEDIQKPASENSNAAKDHCTVSVGEETVKESSQEDEEAKKPEVEVFEVLETNGASEVTAKQIIEDTVLTHLSTASIGEETLKENSQEDEAHERIEGAGDGKVTEKEIIEEITATDLPPISLGEETIRSSEENEVCKEVQTTGASEDAVQEFVEEHGAVTDIEAIAIGEVTSTEEYIQKTASDDNTAVKDHCTVSVGEETAKESYQEDEEAKKPNVEVFEGLETNGASKDTAKHIVEDGSVTYLSTASIGEETIKESSQEDEVHEKIEEVGDGKVTEEQNQQIIEEEIAATDLPTISLGEERVRNSQEDEVCKELETAGPSENSIKESVEEHGAVTDISAVAIAEVTTTENSQEKEKEAKSQGQVKASDLISKELNFNTTDCTQNIETVTLTNEEHPNKNPITSVITEASGEEIQEERNEKLAGSSLVSEEHIEGEISEKEAITNDKLETEPVSIVNEKISLNEAEPEGAELIDASDFPSEEMSPVPIEATGTSLQALHVEDMKVGENSNSDENAQSKVSFVEETIQSAQEDEVEKKDEAEVSDGLVMDDLSKDTEEKIIEEYDVVKEHCTVSDVEETVKQTNQEDEKGSEEEDCMGTKTTITDEDIASENSNAVKDHCTESVGEETVKESSQEEEAKTPEVEVFEVLETNGASEVTAKQIIEDTVLTHLSTASIGEETLKESSHKDEAHERIEGAGDGMVTEKEIIEEITATDLPTISLGEETIRSSEENEVCKEVQTTSASEDAVQEFVEEHGAVTDIEAISIGEVTSTEDYIQKTASKDNTAVKDHCTLSVGEETAKESYQEDEEAKKPNVEVFEGLETNGASENTAKHIVEDGSVTYLSTASIGKETIKESSQEDEVHEKIEEVGDGKVIEEQIIEEEVAATDFPIISLGEETVRSSQEDEVCKELETTGPSEDPVKEYVEEHGAVTDISAVAIGEVTTTESSQEEEKETKSQGEVKESDLISKELNFKTTDCTQNIEAVTLKNEEYPNKIPTTSAITEASGEELPSSVLSEVSKEHIEGEISEKEAITNDKLETEPVPIVEEEISLNEAEPEGAELIDASDLPSEEMSPVPLEANGTSLQALHVEDVKLEGNSNSDENALKTENPYADGTEDETKYNMTLGDCAVPVPESDDHGTEISSGTQVTGILTPPDNESEKLQETSTLSSGQQDPESVEANGKIKDESPREESSVQKEEICKFEETSEVESENTGKESATEELQKEEGENIQKPRGSKDIDTFSEEISDTPNLAMHEKKLETIELEEKINDEYTVKDEIKDSNKMDISELVKVKDEEVLEQSSQKDELEVDNEERWIDLVSEELDTVDSSAYNEKDTSDKGEGPVKNLEERKGGELSEIDHTRETELQKEVENFTDPASMQQNLIQVDLCEKSESVDIPSLEPREEVNEEDGQEEAQQATEAIGESKITETDNEKTDGLAASGLMQTTEMECVNLEEFDPAEKLIGRDKVEDPVKNLEERFNEERNGGELSEIDHTRQTELQNEVENSTGLASKHEDLKPVDACENIQSAEMDHPYKHEDVSSNPNLKPREEISKEDGQEEAQVIEPTEERKSTETVTLDHEKTDGLAASGLIQTIEMECVDLEEIDQVEKHRGAAESVAENQSHVTITETEKEGKAFNDQNTESIEDPIIGQSTQEEEKGSKKLEETILESEEQNHEAYYATETTKNCVPSEKVPQEVERADESEEIEKQITEEEVAAKELYTVSMRDEAVKEVTDSDLVPTEGNIEVTDSNDKTEIATITDEENCNSRPDIAAITEAAGEETLKKEDCKKLLEVSPLLSEVPKGNNKETDDTSGLLKIESVIVATEETSSQDVEPEVEKIVLPFGIESEEKSLERVETTEICLVDDEVKSANLEEKFELVSQPPTTEDGNQNQERLIEEKLDVNKFEEEIKDELVAASDAVSESEDQGEETIIESDAAADLSQTAENLEQKLQESSALVSEAQELEISATEKIKDNSTIEHASEIVKNQEIETIVDQNTVSIGDECAGKSFQEDKMGAEHLEEGIQVETGENQSEKSEANEYPEIEIANEEISGRLEKGSTRDYIEKQITKEEVSVNPYQVSVQKMVKDKEDEEKGEKLEDEVQVEPEEQRHDLEAEETQSAKTYEANETKKKEISNEEVCAGLENIGTSESSEKQIPGEEGSVEEPYLISVGKETVKESYQEEHKGEQLMEEATKYGPEEQSNELEAEEDRNGKLNETTEITQKETVNDEIRILQGLENAGASETNEKLITEEEEPAKNPYEKWANKILEAETKLNLEDQNHEAHCRDHTTENEEIALVETKSETEISTEARETVIVKDEKGPDMNLHDPPATPPYEEAPMEETGDMVVKLSALVPEETIMTNSENMTSATEDARSPTCLLEVDNLKNTSSELASKPIVITEDSPLKDEGVPTKVDASVLIEASLEEIPKREDKTTEDEGRHIFKQAIAELDPPTEGIEGVHIKDEAPVEEILKKEAEKKLDESNIQEKVCENEDTKIQTPKQEETQVFLAVEQATAERSIMASTDKISNISDSVVQEKCHLKTDLQYEAQVQESETTEITKLEYVDSLNEKLGDLSDIQPSVKEILEKEATMKLAEGNETPQSVEKIEKSTDTPNEEQGSGEMDFNESTETNIPTGSTDTPSVPEDQSGRILEKTNIEDLKRGEISEIEPKVKGTECGQDEESIDEPKPSDSDKISLSSLLQRSKKETPIEERESLTNKELLESEVPPTVQVEDETKEEEKYEEEEEEDEHKKEDSGSDAPVMVEASTDIDVKPAHKKSHNILFGVGSKVKHSIAKVKKAITGKSSQHKSTSPKQESG